MNHKADISPANHNEIRTLLPWYANKSLNGSELVAVESHLRDCLICRREMQHLDKLAQAIKLDDSYNSAENAAFARLKQRIEAQSVTSRNQINGNFSGKQRWNVRMPFFRDRTKLSPSVWAVAATLFLAVAIPLNFYQNNGSNGAISINHFKTLSNGQSEQLSTHQIRVVFSETVDTAGRQQVADSIHGLLMDEPSPQGVYTVSLPQDLDEKGVLGVIKQLRKDRRVVFAEPAYALLSGMSQRETP